MKNFDSPMKVSWLILSAIDIALVFYSSKTSGYGSPPLIVLNTLLAIVFPALFLFLIKKLCVSYGDSEQQGQSFNIWSYIWRSFIIKYTATITSLIVILPMFGKGPYPTVPMVICISIIVALFSVLMTWVFFSKDRKGQFNWLLSLTKGY